MGGNGGNWGAKRGNMGGNEGLGGSFGVRCGDLGVIWGVLTVPPIPTEGAAPIGVPPQRQPRLSAVPVLGQRTGETGIDWDGLGGTGRDWEGLG